MPNGENCSLAELEVATHAAPTQKAFVRLSDFYTDDREALIARLDQALNWLIARSNENQRTAAIHV